eukprot:TRINITY_DN64260_c0_g1_i1.p1 TRINITY_DN64260_c0_g1~~TRINITY_DN64260_c0_g1_i1.p1  ORF type:complete len:854 (+),score=148.37 TRINITY_DN64260_c0_g1_i1:61-2622(+)
MTSSQADATNSPPRKRHRAAPSPDVLNALVKSLLSDDATTKTLALDHAVRLTSEPEGVRALCEHALLDDLLAKTIIPMAVAPLGDVDQESLEVQSDAISILINLSGEPKLGLKVWTGLREVDTKVALQHPDLPSLLHSSMKIMANASGFCNETKKLSLHFVADVRKAFEDSTELRALVRWEPFLQVLQCDLDDDGKCCLLDTCITFEACDDLALSFAKLPAATRTAFMVSLIEYLAMDHVETGCLTAMLLGNFLRTSKGRKGFTDLIANRDLVTDLISNTAYYLDGLSLTEESARQGARMAMFMLYRVLELQGGLEQLASHEALCTLMGHAAACVEHATPEDDEVLYFIFKLLDAESHKERMLQAFMLDGTHLQRLFQGLCALIENNISTGDCADIIEVLVEKGGENIVLACGMPTLTKILACLSKNPDMHHLLDSLMPLLKWQTQLMSALALSYKQAWISTNTLDETSGEGAGASVHIVVHRDRLLSDFCASLASPTASLQRGLDVQFTGNGESGLGDGHRREFFRLTASEFVNPDMGLFQSKDGGRTYHISSTAAEAQPDNLAQLELCGKFLGLALLHGETLPSMCFTPALCKLLLGKRVDMHDMKAVDPEFYNRKVVYILEGLYNTDGGNPEALADLGLTFEDSPQPDVFPDVKQQLCPLGAAKIVTEKNKKQYLSLLCDYRLRVCIRAQLAAMIKGLCAVLPVHVYKQMQLMLTPDEFNQLISGKKELDLAAWKANSFQSEGLSEETWNQFWTVVAELTEQDCGNLLEFVTGSSTLPAGGFAALPGYGGPGQNHVFTVAPPRRPGLPTAATCFNTLYLPTYRSVVEMRHALLEAIAHRGTGFHEGAVAQ